MGGIQGQPSHTGFFHLAIRTLRCYGRIGNLGFNQPLHMDILLYDDKFLVAQPIWSQYLQNPGPVNFTLMSDA